MKVVHDVSVRHLKAQIRDRSSDKSTAVTRCALDLRLMLLVLLLLYDCYWTRVVYNNTYNDYSFQDNSQLNFSQRFPEPVNVVKIRVIIGALRAISFGL